MAIVNFAIPKTLEKRVEEAIRTKGFASKAEFFRFAAVYFMDVIDRKTTNEADRFEYLTEALEQEVSGRYGNTILKSARNQLADI